MKCVIAGCFSPGGNTCGCDTRMVYSRPSNISGNHSPFRLGFSSNLSREVRVGWSGAQPQILHGSADGEMVKALPVVAGQTERAVQHVIEVATDAGAANPGRFGR